jgi:hypothetical protein
MIRETILTTMNAEGRLHITPIGIIADGDGWIIAPFRPSTTLDNLRAMPFAVANHTDDVRIFAGCLTGRHDWPTRASDNVPVPRLTGALAHTELAVVGVAEDEQRPRFQCAVVSRGVHAPFAGFNRAQAGYLETAIEKTAGAQETEAWTWLMEAIRAHYGGQSRSATSNRRLT